MTDRSEKLKEYTKTVTDSPVMGKYLEWCSKPPRTPVQSFPLGAIGELEGELAALHLYCDDLELELKEARAKQLTVGVEE